MDRLRYIGFRALNTIFLLWLVMTVLFLFFRFLPGSYIDILVAEGASQDTIDLYEEQWRLNEPLYSQYIAYVQNFLLLDMGQSIQYSVPVWSYVNHRILNTLVLVAPGVTLGYILGTIAGAVLGSSRGSKLENYGVFGLVMVGSLPRFFIAIVLVALVGIRWGLAPTGGMATPQTISMYSDSWWRIFFTTDFLHHWILPFIVVVIVGFYPSAMVMRTSVVEVSGQDFLYYNKVSGLPYGKRLARMANHAVLPVITLYPISVGQAISGLVLIELVFNWPGIGFTLVEAVFARDYPVVQFVFFVTAAFVIIANFFVDILYGVIDPRISVGE